MSLLLPLALWGLLSLPLILLLHLLRNRREPRPISSLQIWRGLQRAQGGTQPRRLLLSLMLLLQVIAAAGLTFALARPALSSIQAQPRQTIFLLDTTTSMAAVDLPDGLQRLDRARQVIETHLASLEEGDTVTVIRLNAHPAHLITADVEQQGRLLAVLADQVPGGTGIDLAAALTLADGLVNADRLAEIVVLTDGDYAVTRTPLPPLEAPVSWSFAPGFNPAQEARPERVPNQALLNLSALRLPDGRHRLFVRVLNYAETTTSRRLRVLVDGELFDETTVRVAALGEVARTWTLPAPATTAGVELVEPDALLLDNRAELLLARTTRRRVLLVSESPDLLARALEAQPGVTLSTVLPDVPLPQPDAFDLIVLDGLPSALTAWPAGNLLVVGPPLGHPLLPAESSARNLRPDPERVSPLLSDIDLSGVYFSRVPVIDVPDWAEVDLWAMPASAGAGRPEQPLVFHGSVADSHVIVWAFDPAQSNLPPRLAFPLLTANSLSHLLAAAPPAAVSVGDEVSIRVGFGVQTPEGTYYPTPDSGDAPRGDSYIFTDTRQPGLYRVTEAKGAVVSGFAVHAGSALESNLLRQVQPQALPLAVTSASASVVPETVYRELWPWLALLVLAVLLIEGGLAWRR